MALLTVGSIDDLLPPEGVESQLETTDDLPGLTLSSLTIKRIMEPPFQWKAEVYLLGVAVDASNEVRIVPFGYADFKKEEVPFELTRKVGENETVEYLGAGLPLLIPPLRGFLALRLLVVDSDAAARKIAPILKEVAKVAANESVVLALAATGMGHAAAVAFTVGKAIEAASLALEKNGDDVISLFEGYFSGTDMIVGETFTARTEGANASFRWVA